jgi:hypothetical protein
MESQAAVVMLGLLYLACTLVEVQSGECANGREPGAPLVAEARSWPRASPVACHSTLPNPPSRHRTNAEPPSRAATMMSSPQPCQGLTRLSTAAWRYIKAWTIRALSAAASPQSRSFHRLSWKPVPSLSLSLSLRYALSAAPLCCTGI